MELKFLTHRVKRDWIVVSTNLWNILQTVKSPDTILGNHFTGFTVVEDKFLDDYWVIVPDKEFFDSQGEQHGDRIDNAIDTFNWNHSYITA